MGEQAVALARTAGYRSAGTVEFVVDTGRNFYFLEMNTRLQVEHPVTERVTGIDLVAEQIRIARGEPLALGQDDICLTGHAIECRIYAEDADAGFLPATGTVLMFKAPEDPGLRFDHGIVEGQSVSSAFDPMLGKLISHGDTRKKAIDLALEALHKTVILGVKTNIDFMTRVLRHPVFTVGEADTGFIGQHENELIVAPASDDELSVLVAAAALATRSPGERRYDLPEPLASFGGWRN